MGMRKRLPRRFRLRLGGPGEFLRSTALLAPGVLCGL